MDWPSERVSQGGMFHTAKVNYSPETKKFLQELMQESNLTMQQRNKINYTLRNGEPLPSLASTSSVPEKKINKSEVIIKTGISKRRGYNSIVESGAYQREPFVPAQRGVDREYAKQHLQDFMAYGKEIKKDDPTKIKEIKEMPEINRFDEIKQEIKERVDWLAEMDELGEGHKYKVEIEQQIAARIREMSRLKPTKTETSTEAMKSKK